MPMWLGEAPEWVKENLRKLYPYMREHAEDGAKRHFAQYRDDQDRIIKGPPVESMFEFFIGRYADVEIPKVWTPERTTEVLAHLQIKYAVMVMEAYNRQLLSPSE
jgi:hypothetical protein